MNKLSLFTSLFFYKKLQSFDWVSTLSVSRNLALSKPVGGVVVYKYIAARV